MTLCSHDSEKRMRRSNDPCARSARVHNGRMDTTAKTIVVRGRTLIVSERDKCDRDGRVVYRLRGERGADYFTIRNQVETHMMFVCDNRGFGIASTMKGVWLSDKDGELRVVKQ